MLSNYIPVSSLCQGLTYALFAVGISLFSVGPGLVNLGFLCAYVVAGYSLHIGIGICGMNYAIGAVFAYTCTVIFAFALDRSTFQPLRRFKVASHAFLLVSLALLLIVQNAVSLIFGDQGMFLRPQQIEKPLDLLGLAVMPSQATTVVASALAMVGVGVLYRITSIGQCMRASVANPDLASVVGIRQGKVACVGFIAGSAIATIAALVIASDNGIRPNMGVEAALAGLVTSYVGGVRSLCGAMLAGFFVSSIQQLAIVFLSSQWQDAVAFVVLLLFLLFRPQGFMGRKLRKAAI